MIVSSVFLREHGIDAAGQAEGEKIEQDLLILLQAPCPQSIGRAGDLAAPVLFG